MTDNALRGWKEISTFLGTSERTAQRWETELELPVHRLSARPGTAVFAHREELRAWRQSKAGKVAAEQVENENAPEIEEKSTRSPLEATEAEDAPTVATAEPRSWLRLHWGAVAAALAVILCVAAVLLGRTLIPQSAPGKVRQPPGTTERTIVFVRLEWMDAPAMRVAIPDGGVARVDLGGTRLQLSADVLDAELSLGVSQVGDATTASKTEEITPIARVRLRPGVRALVRGPSPFAIEWLLRHTPAGQSSSPAKK